MLCDSVPNSDWSVVELTEIGGTAVYHNTHPGNWSQRYLSHRITLSHFIESLDTSWSQNDFTVRAAQRSFIYLLNFFICVPQNSYRFGLTSAWVNARFQFIFNWTIPLRTSWNCRMTEEKKDGLIKAGCQTTFGVLRCPPHPPPHPKRLSLWRDAASTCDRGRAALWRCSEM